MPHGAAQQDLSPADPEVCVVDPGQRLHDYLRVFYLVFQGKPKLYVFDDCSATKALKQSVWVLT